MENKDVQAFPGGMYHPGMTLRDYFAGQALIGLFSHPDSIPGELGFESWIGSLSYEIADAMMKEREKQ